jgi:hypothetical protein
MNLFKTLTIVGLVLILVSLALPSAGHSINKGPLVKTLINYRKLFIVTQCADNENVSIGGKGAFPGIATNGWSNALVTNYISASDFRTLLSVNGEISNTTIYKVTRTNDPRTVFLATANLSSNGVSNKPPFGLKGGALVTVGGSAIKVTGTNTSKIKDWNELIWLTNTVQP